MTDKKILDFLDKSGSHVTRQSNGIWRIWSGGSSAARTLRKAVELVVMANATSFHGYTVDLVEEGLVWDEKTRIYYDARNYYYED